MPPLEYATLKTHSLEMLELASVMAMGEEALDRARGTSNHVQRVMERIAENEALLDSDSSAS